MCARFLVASVFQRGADGRQRVVLSSSARKTELRPQRFGEWTGNPAHSLPPSVASRSSGMIVLWCTVHISSPCPHTFRYPLHDPHRAIVPLFARVHCFNSASSITEALFRYFSVPSVKNPKHTHISFALHCEFASHHRRLLLIAVKWLKNCWQFIRLFPPHLKTACWLLLTADQSVLQSRRASIKYPHSWTADLFTLHLEVLKALNNLSTHMKRGGAKLKKKKGENILTWTRNINESLSCLDLSSS